MLETEKEEKDQLISELQDKLVYFTSKFKVEPEEKFTQEEYEELLLKLEIEEKANIELKSTFNRREEEYQKNIETLESTIKELNAELINASPRKESDNKYLDSPEKEDMTTIPTFELQNLERLLQEKEEEVAIYEDAYNSELSKQKELEHQNFELNKKQTRPKSKIIPKS